MLLPALVGPLTFQNFFEQMYFLNERIIILLVKVILVERFCDSNQLSCLLVVSGHISRESVKLIRRQIVFCVPVWIDGRRECFVRTNVVLRANIAFAKERANLVPFVRDFKQPCVI